MRQAYPEQARGDFLRPRLNPLMQVGPGDLYGLTGTRSTDTEMDMGMAVVVVIDPGPLHRVFQIAFHGAHHALRELRQGEPVPVLRGQQHFEHVRVAGPLPLRQRRTQRDGIPLRIEPPPVSLVLRAFTLELCAMPVPSESG